MPSLLRLAACAALVACSTPPATHQPTTLPAAQTPRQAETPPTVGDYQGLYSVTTDEDHFVPCGISGVGDGWALKFRNPREAVFIGPTTIVRGYGALTHFIRVRGTLDSSSRYNRGFQTHQLTVDTVLDVKETPQACPTYEDLPATWNNVKPTSRQLRGATISADWKLAAVMDEDGTIAIWNVDRGQMLKQFETGEKFDPQLGYRVPMVFSRDGNMLFVGGSDGTVRVWSPLSGILFYSLSHPDSTPGYNDIAHNSMMIISAISLNKSETLLAATNSWVTRIWSLTTRQPIAEYNTRMAGLGKVFFVDDGSLLVADYTGTLTSYSGPGAPPQWSAKIGSRAAQYATRSADEKWIAFNGWGDSLFLWSVPNRARGPVLNVPTTFGGDGGIDFSPDGKIIATSGGSNGLYLWDVSTGAPIRSFHRYPGPVHYAWFLPDGKSIVTYSWNDNVFRITKLDSPGPSIPANQTDSMAILLAPSNQPRTVAAVVKGPNQRAVPSAEVLLMNGDAPDSVVQRTITSPGGYFSFSGVRFPHVIVCVRKSGFEDGIMYMHQRRYDPGPGEIDLSWPPTLHHNDVWLLPIRQTCDSSPTLPAKH